MLRDFKVTRNPKRCEGRCGSHIFGSQSTNKGEGDAFSGKIVRKTLRFLNLEAKKQQADNSWFSLIIKATKQCMCNYFYGLKCIKQGLAKLLIVFKEPKSYCNIFRGFKEPRKLWLMLLEAKPHRQGYQRRIYRSQKNKQNIAHVYSGKLKKRKFSCRAWRLKTKFKEQLLCFHVKML